MFREPDITQTRALPECAGFDAFQTGRKITGNQAAARIKCIRIDFRDTLRDDHGSHAFTGSERPFADFLKALRNNNLSSASMVTDQNTILNFKIFRHILPPLPPCAACMGSVFFHSIFPAADGQDTGHAHPKMAQNAVLKSSGEQVRLSAVCPGFGKNENSRMTGFSTALLLCSVQRTSASFFGLSVPVR